MKSILFLSIICISSFSAKSQKLAEGYYITLKGDTIPGKFNLKKTSFGTFYKPFNLGMFALSVKIQTGNGDEKEFLPGEIKGFDFKYSDRMYKYRPLKIGTEQLKSFNSDDAPTEVFAEMLVEGNPLSLYDFKFGDKVFHKYSGVASQNNYYYNIYVRTPKGLVQLTRTYKDDEVITMLIQDLKVEKEFIKTIPKKYSLMNIQEVITNYNAWKNEQTKN